jgi:DMSO/TMAO reductase YedYZ molybdopterin-dependent catalytic subunit
MRDARSEPRPRHGFSRREFLALAAGASLAPSAALAMVQKAAGEMRGRMLQLNGQALDAETPLDNLITYITPIELFFVRHHWNPAVPDRFAWRLTVDGEVKNPLQLRVADLRNMPSVTVTCVLQCAGSGRSFFDPPVPGVQWRHGAIGNAQWTGVRLEDLLEKAGVKAAARHVHTSGSDAPPMGTPPFHRSLEIEKALEDAVVAYEMNGRPLPPHHGSPARLVVPGWAGDHWMKYLTRVSAQPKPQKGYYMDTAYRFPENPGEPGQAVPPGEMQPITELPVRSAFTTTPARAPLGTPVTLRGFAVSGAPDIAKVEISDDDGNTWGEAQLDPDHDPYAWRLWSYDWTPRAAGQAKLWARATDVRGSVQPRQAVWNPGGYLHNGWHSVDVEVVTA